MLKFKSVKIKKSDDLNFILGQAHFIKTVEDIRWRKDLLRNIGYKL